MGSFFPSSSTLKKRVHFDIFVNLSMIDLQVYQQDVLFQQITHDMQSQFNNIESVIKIAKQYSENYVHIQSKLTGQSELLINQYFNSLNTEENQYAPLDEKWRLTRYNQNTLQVNHSHILKSLDGHVFFGTQIFLPPNNIISWKSEQLIIFTTKGSKIILPDQTKWTHLIIPRDCTYEVIRVTDESQLIFQKDIWIKEKVEEIQTDQDRQRRKQQEKLTNQRKRQRPNYNSQQIVEQIIE